MAYVPAPAPARAERPGPARVAALVALLTDDSAAVQRAVRDEFERLGPLARRALVRAAHSSDAVTRGRARAALAAIERREVLRRLASRGARDELDLEHSLFLLARHADPHFDARPYVRALDAMGSEVRRRAERAREPLEAALKLVEYLGGELGFRGSNEAYHAPDNIHLHRAIERRQGLPLTLCALYACVGRRAGIRCACVSLPMHVMLRLHGDGRSVLVDAFAGGRVRTRRECEEMLAGRGVTPLPAAFEDADDAHIFQRHVMNLAVSCQTRGLEREADELFQLVRTLSRARECRARRSGRRVLPLGRS